MYVTNTEETNFMLLKNGRVLSWGPQSFTLGRKCKSAINENYVPREIEFKTKILDIACGKNHCLAKNEYYEVYSWGSNEFGQVFQKYFFKILIENKVIQLF